MSAQFMRRNIRISVRLTEEEHRLLKEKMERIGVTNQEAFLRKMALDGLVIKLDQLWGLANEILMKLSAIQ